MVASHLLKPKQTAIAAILSDMDAEIAALEAKLTKARSLGTGHDAKNAVFPIKRRHILRLDKAGMFVPLCTTNAFLKYYSSKVDKMMFWNEGDRNDYFNAIVDTLVDFFTPENGGMT